MSFVANCFKNGSALDRVKKFAFESPSAVDAFAYTWITTTGLRVAVGTPDEAGMYNLLGTIQRVAVALFVARVGLYFHAHIESVGERWTKIKVGIADSFKGKKEEIRGYLQNAGVAGLVLTITGMDQPPARIVHGAYLVAMAFILYGIGKDGVKASE